VFEEPNKVEEMKQSALWLKWVTKRLEASLPRLKWLDKKNCNMQQQMLFLLRTLQRVLRFVSKMALLLAAVTSTSNTWF
jgi:hypothetical protein